MVLVGKLSKNGMAHISINGGPVVLGGYWGTEKLLSHEEAWSLLTGFKLK